MIINRLKLENFQGVRDAEFVFGGRDANIHGANASGKTTLFNAFVWLLRGEASTGASEFTPKTVAGDGDAHNLNHAVECDMEIDGETVTLRRVYHEVYKKTRGNPHAEFSGHATDYYINGVPKTATEWSRYWQWHFADGDVPKLLSMPFYFAEKLHWEKRRGMLLDICGELSDGEIMESDDELKALPGLMGKASLDEYKKTVKAALANINKDIQSIPARIDEAEKAIPDTRGYSRPSLEKLLSAARENISGAEKERAALLAGGGAAASARELQAGLNAEMAEARRAWSARQQEATSGAYETLNALRMKLVGAERELSDARRELENAERSVAEIEKKREAVFAEHAKLKEEHGQARLMAFPESETICPACGQALPPESAGKLREEFNLRKSERLESLSARMEAVVEDGRRTASKEMLAKAMDDVAALEAKFDGADDLVCILKAKASEAEDALRAAEPPAFETTDEYQDISGRIMVAETAGAGSAPDTSSADARISKFRKDEQELSEALAALETERVQKERVAELELQERELGKAYEDAQRALWLCEKFSRAKSAMLDARINGMFKTVRFRLFKPNVTNDGIEDRCDVLVPSENGSLVPFKDANNAARILAGVEIIEVLGGHFRVRLPVFIDNAEGLSKESHAKISSSSQIIRLFVSDSDPALRLELL